MTDNVQSACKTNQNFRSFLKVHDTHTYILQIYILTIKSVLSPCTIKKATCILAMQNKQQMYWCKIRKLPQSILGLVQIWQPNSELVLTVLWPAVNAMNSAGRQRNPSDFISLRSYSEVEEYDGLMLTTISSVIYSTISRKLIACMCTERAGSIINIYN